MSFKPREASPATFFWNSLRNIDDPWNSTIQAHDYFPILKPTCVKNAIDDFMNMCIKESSESISPTIRAWTAVKLSVCEFEAVGLKNIPDNCYSNDLELMMECMLEIEHSTQWWTTYSGNYQRLSSLCNDYNSYYQERRLVETLLNLTDLNYDFSTKYTKQFTATAKENIKNLKKDIINASNELQEHLNTQINNQKLVWKEHLSKQNNVYELSLNGMKDIESLTNLLKDNLTNLSTILTKYIKSAAEEIDKNNIISLYERKFEAFYKVAIEEQKQYKSITLKAINDLYSDTENTLTNLPHLVDNSVVERLKVISYDFDSMQRNINTNIQNLFYSYATNMDASLADIKFELMALKSEVNEISGNIANISGVVTQIHEKIESFGSTWFIIWDIFIWCFTFPSGLLQYFLLKFKYLPIYPLVLIYLLSKTLPKIPDLRFSMKISLLILLTTIGSRLGYVIGNYIQQLSPLQQELQ
ncbi:Nuclear fusion protein KAR5 [Nakaseomyces bracarensis]|uniref:Nuclear fusion protein KAR5 n=1 Tax=Nakaseomyces bracarensis TaxID=273131 RepID=A0ABR4NVK3_9SACH